MSAELASHLGPLAPQVRRILATATEGRHPDGPVVLGPGGWPWDEANSWLHDGLCDLADTTRDAYARDLAAFGVWCAGQGLDPHTATQDDLEDYQEERLGEDRVGAATWNRGLTAITGFLDHLAAQDRREDDIAELRCALRQEVGPAEVTVVSDPDYHEFRSIGLHARAGSAGPMRDEAVGERDALFADLLITSALRRTEASALLLPELLAAEAKATRHLTIAAALRPTGGRGRTVLAGRFLAAHARFRARHLARIAAAAQEHLPDDTEVADHVEGDRLRLDGDWCALDELPADRRRLVVATPQLAARLGVPAGAGRLVPLGLFPSMRSPCPEPTSWTAVFREARHRVADHRRRTGRGPGPWISPRSLRQTAAVRFLRRAIGALDGASRAAVRSDPASALEPLAPAIAELAQRLGHVEHDSTRRYLEFALDGLEDHPHHPQRIAAAAGSEDVHAS